MAKVERVTMTRGAARTEAIMGAVFEVLREVGYEALTIDAVAARAGASKATIYRCWPDKRALVCDVMMSGAERVRLDEGAKTLREDLLALLELMTVLAAPEDVSSFASLLSVAQRDEVIAQTLWHGLLKQRRRECRDVLRRAVARGELRSRPRIALEEELFQLIIGQFLVRLLVSRQGFPLKDRKAFVDRVLLPVLGLATSGDNRKDDLK